MAGVNRWQAKAVLNIVNGTTPLGILLGLAGRARFRRGPRGLVLASDYRLPVPAAPAFTVGNVVLSPRPAAYVDERPALLRHEERHSWQYVACLGVPMVPLYLLAALWSYLRGGDFGVHNPFERHAGLADGGYPLLSARRRHSQRQPRRRRAAAAAP
jgi:hypothetical protein